MKLLACAVLILLAFVGLHVAMLGQDESDPHARQPASCDNYHKTAPAHRCSCNRATECPNGEKRAEDPKCKTYCRPEACKCLHPCTS